jgi:hypothetical protein
MPEKEVIIVTEDGHVFFDEELAARREAKAKKEHDAIMAKLQRLADRYARVDLVLDLIRDNGGAPGSDHKQWILDQVVRILTGDEYLRWLKEYANGEDGPATYEWDEGVAP